MRLLPVASRGVTIGATTRSAPSATAAACFTERDQPSRNLRVNGIQGNTNAQKNALVSRTVIAQPPRIPIAAAAVQRGRAERWYLINNQTVNAVRNTSTA